MVSALSRVLTPINPEWSVPQLQEHLARALSGEGPALSTNQVRETVVDPRVALVVRTSGSTGNPKSVALAAAALLANARATHAFLGAKSGERWSLLLPTSHIAGLNVVIRAIELGTLPVSLNEHADYSAVVPTQLFRAINGDSALLAHLQQCRRVLVGGGALDSSLRIRAEDTGVNVVESYGMTESCGGVIYDGSPLAGVNVKLVEGHIALQGAQINPMYLDGEVNIDDGWFLTSDLGEIIGGRVVVKGRSDDQIISGGEKISLSAIETFLREQFSDQEIVAFAKPDIDWGERLCIAATKSIPHDQVLKQLQEKFGRHVAPKEFFTVASIPYLGIGKPDRKKLAHDHS